jgi:hypothetical protein
MKRTFAQISMHDSKMVTEKNIFTQTNVHDSNMLIH